MCTFTTRLIFFSLISWNEALLNQIHWHVIGLGTVVVHWSPLPDDDSNLTRRAVFYFQLGDAMFVELPRVRLDGGARAFRQHWGYETRPLAPPPPLIEEDEAAIEPETVSLREANTASPIGEYHWSILIWPNCSSSRDDLVSINSTDILFTFSCRPIGIEFYITAFRDILTSNFLLNF